MRPDALEWPNRERWIDVAWVLFSLANLAAMLIIPSWETVPFHFIWVSLTVLYGFRVWRTRPTLTVLAVVMVTTGRVHRDRLLAEERSRSTRSPRCR